MSIEAVQRAIRTAVNQAYLDGQTRARGAECEKARESACQYGETLVLQVMELHIKQEIEIRIEQMIEDEFIAVSSKAAAKRAVA